MIDKLQLFVCSQCNFIVTATENVTQILHKCDKIKEKKNVTGLILFPSKKLIPSES